MVGQTISRYKVLEKLGEGGMGVVYKAEDTKLERPVALKFLPNHLLGDEEVRKRFEREAKAAAALDHSNVCTVYEIDEADGKTFIAMALVEGESLDKQIAQGPLKLEEALDIAQQIAKGLEAAHKRGVVHRDIKPENIMIGGDGHVTIMDFGLAQLTQASLLTRPDQTLGTTFYMSPEQTEGSGTDQRTDIWSLGVVIYEMVTGQQPFKGDYDKAVMYSILNEEPEPITALRTGVPMELERVVGKCLAKAPEDRYQHADELIVDLRSLAAGSEPAKTAVHLAPQVASKPSRLWPAVAAAAILLAVGVSWLHFSEPKPDRPVRKYSFAPADFHSPEARPAISPDGKHIAYTAGSPKTQLWVQSLDQNNPRRLEGTEGAVRPFWSPDSQSIGYMAEGALRRVPVSGGIVAEICPVPGRSYYFLATWSPDGESIVFSSMNPVRLYQVSASGGVPKLIVDRIDSEGATSATSPYWISDQTLLYRLGSPILGGNLVARNMETGQEEEWPASQGILAFSPTGHVLSHPRADAHGDLSALPFRSRPLGPSGSSFPVARDAAFPSVSRTGALVYKRQQGARTLQVRLVDRSGAEIENTAREWQIASQVSFSPDGRQILASVGQSDQRRVWLYDLAGGNWTLLTPNSTGNFPFFGTRGDGIYFSRGFGGYLQILAQAVEPGDSRLLIEGSADFSVSQVPLDMHRLSGALLYYQIENDERLRDLWYYEPDGQGGYTAKPFVSEPFDQIAGSFSPDGEWVAYVSDQEGLDEVYVRKFPQGTPVRKVSRRGGEAPRWRGDGRELFYVDGQTLMAVDVQPGETPSFGTPHALFSEPSSLRDPLRRAYDVAPDGQSFVVISYSAEALASPPVIQVVENWYEEFREREQD